MATDEELRALERAVESDPSAWSRLALAYARLGRHADALDAAIKAGAQSATEPARELLTPTHPTRLYQPGTVVPWRGLRTLTAPRRQVLDVKRSTAPAIVRDGGRGVALVTRDSHTFGYDAIRGELLWSAKGLEPVVALPAGVLAVRSEGLREEVVLVDPVRGDASALDRMREKLARRFTRSSIAAIDERTVVAVSAPEAVVIDVLSFEVNARIPIDEENLVVVADPNGVTIEWGSRINSYDRFGEKRWGPLQGARLLGVADQRCFVRGGGSCRVLSLTTGLEERDLGPDVGGLMTAMSDIILFRRVDTLDAFDRATLQPLWACAGMGELGTNATRDAVLLERTGRLQSLDPRSGLLLAEADHASITLIGGKAVSVETGPWLAVLVIE